MNLISKNRQFTTNVCMVLLLAFLFSFLPIQAGPAAYAAAADATTPSATDTLTPTDFSNTVVSISKSNSLAEAYVTVYATPPRVISTSPANGDVDVPVQNYIDITFDEQILEGTNFNGVTLTDGSTEITALKSVYLNVLTLHPASELQNNVTYSVYIPAGAVKDASGSVDSAETYAFSFTTAKDTTAPVVSITSPGDGAMLNTSNPAITGTAEPFTVVDVYVDNAKYTTRADVQGSWSYFCNPLPDGSHQVYATATDTAGNVGISSTIAFTVDTIAPVVTISSPAGSTTNNNNPTLSYTVSDSNPVTTAIYLKGAAVNKVSGNTLGPLADGAYTLKVQSVDAVGNSSFAQVIFTVDATAPTVQSRNPDPACYCPTNANITVTFNENIIQGSTFGDVKLYRDIYLFIWNIYIPLHCNPTIVGNQIIFNNPTLSSNATYFVSIPQAAVTDKAGNPLAQDASYYLYTQ